MEKGEERQRRRKIWIHVLVPETMARLFLILSLFVDSFYQAHSCIWLNLNLSLRMGIYGWFVFVFFPVSHSPFIWTLLENSIAIGKHISSFLKCWRICYMPTHTRTHICLSVCLSIYRKRARKHPPILCCNFTFLGGGCGSIKWRWTLLLLVELCPHKWNMLKS